MYLLWLFNRKLMRSLCCAWVHVLMLQIIENWWSVPGLIQGLQGEIVDLDVLWKYLTFYYASLHHHQTDLGKYLFFFIYLFIYLIVHPLFFNKFHYMFIVHFLIVYKSHKHRMNPDCCWANWITKINNKAKRNRSLSHCQSWVFELSESNCFFFAWNLFFHIFD